jgi:hypothetical protein
VVDGQPAHTRQVQRGTLTAYGLPARRTGLLVVILLLTVATVAGTVTQAAAARGGKPVAWIVPSTERVRIIAPAGSHSGAWLDAARGETESFQVAIRARGGPLTGASVSVSPLRRAGGGEISGGAVARYREHYVRVSRHSPAWSSRRVRWTWFPDAMVPFVDPVTGRPPRAGAQYRAAPFRVAADRNQPVWVDVAVPRDAAPGVYRGTWTVTSDQGRRSGPVTLRVRDFALPVVPASGSRFQIRRLENRVPAVEDLLLRYRVQPGTVDRTRETQLRDQGLSSMDLHFWSGADISHCAMGGPPLVETVQAAVAAHDPAIHLYDYSADEVGGCPDAAPVLAQWARVLHAADVDHLVTIVPRTDLLDDGTGRPVVDIWVLTPSQFRDLDPALRDQVLTAGGHFWSYQALVHAGRTPNWELDFPITNYRVLGGFLNASQSVTGLLYWAVDLWQQNPWINPNYRHLSRCCFPGEGSLVYPGWRAGVVGVVPSVRLAMVRDGMDDFDYVALLRARGLGAEADQIIAQGASSWSQWTSNRSLLALVRRELADLLEASNP